MKTPAKKMSWQCQTNGQNTWRKLCSGRKHRKMKLKSGKTCAVKHRGGHDERKIQRGIELFGREPKNILKSCRKPFETGPSPAERRRRTWSVTGTRYGPLGGAPVEETGLRIGKDLGNDGQPRDVKREKW